MPASAAKIFAAEHWQQNRQAVCAIYHYIKWDVYGIKTLNCNLAFFKLQLTLHKVANVILLWLTCPN